MRGFWIKNFLYKTIIISLFTFFSCFLVWSEFGLVKHYLMANNVSKKKNELFLIKKEVKALEKEIINWKTDSFYLEKMAREELGMGYEGEVLYLTT